MGIHFQFPKFMSAVIDLGTKSFNTSLKTAKRDPTTKIPQYQLDNLLGGVKRAYNGDTRKQKTLRNQYVALFTQCYRNVQKDPYFYQEIRAVPMFSADLLKSLGLNDWEWDFGRAQKSASGKKATASR